MSQLPDNISQKPSIREVKESSVVFENGEELPVDSLLLCTGYKFVFPFLTAECHVDIQGERVTPLYKHLIHTEYPTLSLLGLPKVICPFPLFDCQVRFVLAALDGSMKLPSREEMDKETKDDYEGRLSQGMPHRYAHHMGSLQWGYNDDLAKTSNFKPIPDVVRKLYDGVHEQRTTKLTTYKLLNYELLGPETFRQVNKGDH